VREPRYEGMALLGEAIHCATEELKAPVNRVEVTTDHVQCWAGSKTVTSSHYCSHGGFLDEQPRGRDRRWIARVTKSPPYAKAYPELQR
jgi:hypothetical protein